ncbi:TetR/AcrR family transcriptional regulator [Mesorhizobium sp. PAMC28654]|uniref:TetR/AcrR family transcriptional regulator n=1 Tax=Mesorhizobium sp. PAMC28654 TaxID=2880934 RepID=UPI001D0B81F7|nr:TetR/AcrR family transcriptional regulator [Mesorhizobium sp. PAMC28654]UDL89458.1 TetR/AcrR family transcriptional regulator [Mesorhizobium sp. PAMC28654]
MARPLSEEKRQAILASAAALVATQGTGAPTARIARDAGLAEGTLFNYFASKDELLNQLYLAIKADLGIALLTSYPSQASVRDRSRHVWNNFIDWGAKHPMKRKAMRQLTVSERITEQSKQQGNAAFGDINRMIEESLADGVLKGCSMTFAGGIFEALAETTLEFIARDPQQREQYKDAGFAFFWNGISK